MRIGILTHPQGANYGGILQCYALYTKLKMMGHLPIIIRREANSFGVIWELIKRVLTALHFPRYYKPNAVDRLVNIRPFIEKYLGQTEPIKSQRSMLSICNDYNLDAVIVGSDQVWRHDFSMKYGYNYFLDFVPDNVLKISFAASFGLSNWHYTHQQTEKIKFFLNRFKAVSVREEEAVALLSSKVSVHATQLVDPTLLLTEKDYSKITSDRKIKEKYVFVYWLGDKNSICHEVDVYREKGLKIIELYLRDVQEQISIEDWLSYIKYADLVITDSFHGSVFSIIFKRQFLVFGNASGGNGRIQSLCSMFDIDLIEDKNYLYVEEKIDRFKQIAEDYLSVLS